MIEIMAQPPPKVKAPILKNVKNRVHNFVGGCNVNSGSVMMSDIKVGYTCLQLLIKYIQSIMKSLARLHYTNINGLQQG